MDIIRVIHPDDQMWKSGEAFYWDIGASAVRCIKTALELAWQPPVRHILDLPCGHGRVARHLRANFPKAEISFCDIDQSGVNFCAKVFEGSAIYSQPELTDVDVGSDYDIIWIGSLFTHVDHNRTERWLRFLCSRLSERGVLLATFHGAASISLIDRFNLWGLSVDQIERIKAAYHELGYGYERYPYMPDADYGVSISQPHEIVKIAEGIEGRVLLYSERMWADNHDVLSICRKDRLSNWT